MSDASPQMGAGRFTLKAVNTFIGVAGFVMCLTVLFYCMRTVMDMGGTCASGGPYVVARPCPSGVGWMTPVSIFAGLAFLGWMVAWNIGMPGPKWVLLAWPALFLSLGYNFWDYGLDAPGDEGANAGWIVCGVLFVLMGGLPLLALKSRTARKAAFWADASTRDSDPLAIRPPARMVIRAAKPTFPRHAAATPPPHAPPPYAPPFTGSPPAPDSTGTGDLKSDMVGELQRLAAMHRAGELSDEEFEIAKQHILGVR